MDTDDLGLTIIDELMESILDATITAIVVIVVVVVFVVPRSLVNPSFQRNRKHYSAKKKHKI